jgi:hypothetical protein
MSEWEQIAREADEKKARGESTGPPPAPIMIPKRRIDGSQGPIPRSVSALDGIEDMSSVGQTMMLQRPSPPQPSLRERFPALTQAGPVQQTVVQSSTPSLLSKHISPHQTPLQSQQSHIQARPSRGPALGYFNTEPQRPIIQSGNAQQPHAAPDAVSQRSLMVAQEAQIERQQALRLVREQAQVQAQAQQHAHQQAIQKQHAMERERQLQMKQENEISSLHLFEPYSTAPSRSGTQAQARPDPSRSHTQPEIRRTAPPQQYRHQPQTQQPNHQTVRSLLGEGTGRELKLSPSPGTPRAPMSAPPATHEQYQAPAPPPAQPTPPAAPRQQEPVRKSNIMSLLNDEPSDLRPPPPKRVNDVTSAPLQTSRTPPPQHSLPQSRFPTHPSQAGSQPPQQMAPQMPQKHQPSQHQQHQQHQQPQHSYAQPQHPVHQHTPSVGQARSYTPNSFENRGYGQPPMQQQQQQQPIYSQPSRQPISSQAPSIRRESSLGDVHGAGSYTRTPAPSQTSMRGLVDSPYAATPPPAQQAGRQAGSPLEPTQASERDYYSRQSQYLVPQPSNPASAPQTGPNYHTQASQPAPNHRQMAFGQGISHTASPPTQYATQRPAPRSRQNSFDGRYPAASAPAPTPPQQGYIQTPQHQLPLQYQAQHPGQDRFDSNYDRDRRAQEERRHQEEAAIQRRLEDAALQRRLEESRRGF